MIDDKEKKFKKYPIIVVLSHFHQKNGGKISYSYPETILDKESVDEITMLMESGFKYDPELFKNVKNWHYYIEIPSKWAKENKERLLLSIIINQAIDPKYDRDLEIRTLSLCNKFLEGLKSKQEIFHAFK